MHRLVFLAVILLCSCGAARGEDLQANLSKIFADWEHRQASTRNARYVITGEGLVPKGIITTRNAPEMRQTGEKALPKQDFTYEKSRTVLLDFENNRIRKETLEYVLNESKGSFFPVRQTEVFDGSLSKIFFPIEGNTGDFNRGKLNPELWMRRKDQQGGVHFEPDDQPIFLAHGIIASSIREELVGKLQAPQRLRVPLNKNAFTVRGHAIHDQRECLILRTKLDERSPKGSFFDYWVDVGRGSAITRVVTYRRGKVYDTATIYYEETPYGWLPSRWTRTHGADTIPGSPGWFEQSSQLKVKERVVNAVLDPRDFDIPLRPGMVVIGTEDNPLRVANDGHTLMPITQTGRKRWPFLLSLALSAGVAIIIVRWLIRRRRYATRATT